uniref:Protein kinase domain-containing protein n=1 Tax=Angiostrongylus cantonensis TaxID=6313 RepID=A0A0K0DAE4_ANGCA
MKLFMDEREKLTDSSITAWTSAGASADQDYCAITGKELGCKGNSMTCAAIQIKRTVADFIFFGKTDLRLNPTKMAIMRKKNGTGKLYRVTNGTAVLRYSGTPEVITDAELAIELRGILDKLIILENIARASFKSNLWPMISLEPFGNASLAAVLKFKSGRELQSNMIVLKANGDKLDLTILDFRYFESQKSCLSIMTLRDKERGGDICRRFPATGKRGVVCSSGA